MQTLGKYQIRSTIGQGGFGRVYLAFDPSVQRQVAIKVLEELTDPSLEVRFRTEARIAGSLQHRNIVTIFDYGEDAGRNYIVMEYLDGPDLRTLIKRKDSLTLAEKLDIMSQAAEGLGYAHANQIVHRDIKPGNIIVLADSTVKIMDFGIARVMREGSLRLTQRGHLAGTVLYMAPEQLMGTVEADALTDIWSFGALFYELITGVNPFGAADPASVMYGIISVDPQPASSLNPEIPASLDAILQRLLAKDRTLRYPSLQDLQFDLLPVQREMAGTLIEKARRLMADERINEAAALMSRVAHFSPGDAQAVGLRAEIQQRLQQNARSQRIAALLKQAQSAMEARNFQNATSLLESALKMAPHDPEVAKLLQRIATERAKPPLLPKRVIAPSEVTAILKLPTDRRISERDLAIRQTDELIEMGTAGRFSDAIMLSGQWLPGADAADPLLLPFREASRYLLAARTAGTYIAVEHLTRAEAILIAAGSHILQSKNDLAAELPRALAAWKEIARDGLENARAKAASELPNPFRAGQPLRPEQGRSLFRGRDGVVRQIESILTEAGQSGSIALLGPRRCGKTSILQMLPILLPDCVCVFFDLQDNPVETPAAFFKALESQARLQAKRDRGINLPEIEEGPIFSAAMAWMKSLDEIPEDVRILLCIDEFERLQDLFPGSSQELLKLMGVFRATIQHRRRLRLMVSGVAPFDELGQMWNDHFINVRQIGVGHLDRNDSIELLRKPVPEFPDSAIPLEVAAAIYARTGGQPYLLQLYGSILVTRLNAESRRQASAADVQSVEEEAMDQGTYYFRHTYEVAPEDARLVLEDLARGKQPEISRAASRWLTRRGLQDERGGLAIPVLGAFMRGELGL